MAISSKTEPRTVQKAAPLPRFKEKGSSHREAGSELTDYGFPAKPRTRFTPNSSSHHDLDSAAADYGYKIVAKTEHLPYYAPYKDKGDKKKPSALDKGLKERKDLKPPSSKKELMEVIEALPEGVLRPIYRAAARQITGFNQEALGIDRLRDAPPRARWSTRKETEDSLLSPKEFVLKYYGEFLDGTVSRRDIEEYDARLVRALRDMPPAEQSAINLPAAGDASAKADTALISQLEEGRNGPISFDRLKRLVFSHEKRLRPK